MMSTPMNGRTQRRLLSALGVLLVGLAATVAVPPTAGGTVRGTVALAGGVCAAASIVLVLRAAHLARRVRGPLASMIASGQARPARRSLQDLPPPEPGTVSLSDVLAARRDDERW